MQSVKTMKLGTISTSGSRTSGGKHASGKLIKIRSDILFLMLVKASRRIVVLTEEDMYELCMKESLDGRVPHEIEFLHAKLPEELAKNLDAARKKASAEVSPRCLKLRGGIMAKKNQIEKSLTVYLQRLLQGEPESNDQPTVILTLTTKVWDLASLKMIPTIIDLSALLKGSIEFKNIA